MIHASRQPRTSSSIAAPILLLALLALLLAVGPTRARTPLEQEWSRYNGWQVASFHLEGAPQELTDQLTTGLALHGRPRLLRSRLLPEFHTRLLLEDLARARLFLARAGFPAAVITPVASPREDQRKIGVTFRVDPRPPVQVAGVELIGWPDGVTAPDSTTRGVFQPGERFRDAKLESSRQFLQRHLRDRGCALVEIQATVRPVSPAEVAVVYTLAHAEIYTISEVAVTGGSADLHGVTRRLLDLEPPQIFNQTRLDEAAFDLRSTQLFRQVAFTTQATGSDRLRVTASVEDARMRTLEASLGTWSDNPWAVRGGWRHRNLLGGGKGLDATAALATHTQNVGAGLTWFGWLSPRARTRLGAQWLREDEDAYLSQEKRLDLTQNLRPRRRDLANLGVSISRVDLTTYTLIDRSTADHLGTLLEIWADRKWDWTDDPLYPRGGGFTKLSVTWAPPLNLSDSPYLSLQGDASLYRAVGTSLVLAVRGRAGWAQSLGDAPAVIPNRRFYAGGYSSMRGYARRQLGPRGFDGVATGGDLVLLAGLEARVKVIWILGLAFFLDAGQVWWQPTDLRLDQVQAAPGVSLDVRTPLGPLRLGYAWNLGEVPEGEPSGLAHFGVGYPW